MGLFSSKKTYVASTLYNLAGPEDERPNFLRNMIAGNVLTQSKFSMGETLRSGYMSGPGIKLKNFFRWADDNYDYIGVPSGSIGGLIEIDAAVLAPQIPNDTGKEVLLQSVYVSKAEYSYWADQWMMENHPTLVNTDWVSDYNPATGVITIIFADLTTATFSPGFNKDKIYLYATYSLVQGTTAGAVVPGSTIDIDSAAFPSTAGWTELTNVSSTPTQTINTTVVTDVTYADGRPSEHTTETTSSNPTYTLYSGSFEKTDYLGATQTVTEDKVKSSKKTMYFNQTSIVVSSTGSTTTSGTVTNTSQTTNMAVWTRDPSNGSWSNVGITITSNSIANHNGDITADTITASGTSFHYVAQLVNSLSAQPYTQSTIVKAGSVSWIAMSWGDHATNDGAYFDLSTGVVGNVYGPTTAAIENLGNGWYRCSITRTFTGGGTYILVSPQLGNGTPLYYTAAGEYVYIAHVQLRSGTAPGTIYFVDAPTTAKTTTTTTTTESLQIDRNYRIDTQEIVNKSWSASKMWIYEIGSGNAVLDTLVLDETLDGEYYPFIPIRVDNEFLSPTNEVDAYNLAKKAYKKATGAKFDDLIDQIADNDELEEIDYAYIVYGVSLNTAENASKEYLYRYFNKLRLSQTSDNLDYLAWQEKAATADSSTVDWLAWRNAQNIIGHVLYGTAPPDITALGSKPSNRVIIRSEGDFESGLDMEITWQSITESTGTGLGKTGAKKGDLWFETSVDINNGNDVISASAAWISATREIDGVVTLTWQLTENSWKKLTIIGMKHKNYVYNGNAVEIHAAEAINDEEESGFLVPLHYVTVNEMSLVKATQMMTAATYIVFNSYKVVKKKWYQTGIFKIFVYAILIAITVFYPPLGTKLTAMYLSIGTALGFAGLTAILIGAAVSALASMILMRIFLAIGTVLFGEKWGQVFAALATFATMALGFGMLNGLSVAESWGAMMSAVNIIPMTIAAGAGISGYLMASAKEMNLLTEQTLKDYNKDMTAIQELWDQNLGFGLVDFNPLLLTDLPYDNFMETEEQFLSRTLLTGSDIAEMSMNMITHFSELTLSLGQLQ